MGIVLQRLFTPECLILSKDGQSQVEANLKSNPPVHKATYSILSKSESPNRFKIKVDAVYRRRGIPPRIKSVLPLLYRFIKDISAQHIIMSLEAGIGKDVDDFQFPGRNKK